MDNPHQEPREEEKGQAPHNTPGSDSPAPTAEPSSQGQNRPEEKTVMSQIGPIIVAIVIIIIGALLYSRNVTAPSSQNEVESETDISTILEDESDTTETDTETDTDLIVPDNFELHEKAEEIINSTQGKTKTAGTWEYITDGVVPDEDGRYVYFATTDKNANGNFVGVYRYDTENNRWWRATKHTYKAESGQPQTMLRVVGKEGRNLIILVDELGRIPADCESPFLLEDLEMSSMSLDKPLDGLQPYEITNSIKSEEETKQTECQKG